MRAHTLVKHRRRTDQAEEQAETHTSLMINVTGIRGDERFLLSETPL